MMLTYMLARVFGTYLLVAGIAMLLRKKFIMSALGAFVEDRVAQLSLGVFELFLGLIIINVHHDFSTTLTSLVTLLGWGVFLKGVFIMLAPEALIGMVTRLFNKRLYILLDGIFALLLGGYLAAVGYGLI